MRTLVSLTLSTLLAASAAAGDRTAGEAQTLAQLEQHAQALARQFVGELKPQLQQAMRDGGPTHAIAVCSDIAPRLADALSAQSGWLVKRVSLKPRNASRAQPDAWEQTVLQDFDRRQAAGEPAAEIHRGELVGNQYRYMQAQGAGALCLTCHGTKLAPPVQAALQAYYPDDRATGYTLGQVRGAVSLTRNCASGASAHPDAAC